MGAVGSVATVAWEGLKWVPEIGAAVCGVEAIYDLFKGDYAGAALNGAAAAAGVFLPEGQLIGKLGKVAEYAPEALKYAAKLPSFLTVTKFASVII